MRHALTMLLALLPALAGADILHMADGTTRQGRVVETTDKEVVVDFGHGSVSVLVRLPREQVVRIERKATPNATLMANYMARLGKAMKGTADDWHALGLWCLQQRCLNDKATEAFARALALDPDHADTHTALGHVKINDAWMTRKEAVQFLAPELEEAAKLRELEALKQVEEAKLDAVTAQKRAKEIEAELANLRKENADLRARLAVPPPPPPPPRVIYRPIIIYRDRPRPDSPGDGTHREAPPRTRESSGD